MVVVGVVVGSVVDLRTVLVAIVVEVVRTDVVGTVVERLRVVFLVCVLCVVGLSVEVLRVL